MYNNLLRYQGNPSQIVPGQGHGLRLGTEPKAQGSEAIQQRRQTGHETFARRPRQHAHRPRHPQRQAHHLYRVLHVARGHPGEVRPIGKIRNQLCDKLSEK